MCLLSSKWSLRLSVLFDFQLCSCCGVCLNWSPSPAVAPSATRCCNTGGLWWARRLLAAMLTKQQTASPWSPVVKIIFLHCVYIYGWTDKILSIFFTLTSKTMGVFLNAIKNQIIPSSVMLSAINYDCVIWYSKANNKALLSLCLPHTFLFSTWGNPPWLAVIGHELDHSDLFSRGSEAKDWTNFLVCEWSSKMTGANFP